MSSKYNWQRLYEEYQSCGLSKRKFAREKGIEESTVYKAFCKIERKDKTLDKLEGSVFAPVSIVPDIGMIESGTAIDSTMNVASQGIEISYRGARILLANHTDINLLKKVLITIGDVCFE